MHYELTQRRVNKRIATIKVVELLPGAHPKDVRRGHLVVHTIRV